MDWFLLALLAPLFFAVVNLIDDNLIHHVYRGPYFAVIISGLFGAIPLISLLFKELEPLSASLAVAGMTAGFLTAVYYYFYFKALEVEYPSVVIAMFSLTPATVPILAYFFLDERLSYMQLLGFMIVLLASLGLALTEVKKMKFTKALVPVLIAASIFDVVAILSKYTYDHTTFYNGYMLFSLGMGLGALFFMFILRYLKTENVLKDLKRNSFKIITLMVIAEAIAIAAEFTQNLAISRGPVSLVKVIEGIQPIYVLLIALIFYPVVPKYFREAKEGNLVKKFSLMAMIVFGLYLISTTV